MSYQCSVLKIHWALHGRVTRSASGVSLPAATSFLGHLDTPASTTLANLWGGRGEGGEGREGRGRREVGREGGSTCEVEILKCQSKALGSCAY